MRIDEEQIFQIFHDAISAYHRGQYYVSLESDQFCALKVSQPLLADFEESESWDKLVNSYLEQYVIETHRKEIRKIFNRKYLTQQLSIKNREINGVCQIRTGDMTAWIRNRIILSKMNESEKVSHVIVILEEMVEEKISLEEKETERLQFETIANAIPGGLKVNVDDEKFTLKYVSPKTASIVGYTPEELKEIIDRDGSVLFKEGDFQIIQRQLNEQFTRGNTYSLKYRIQCKDGRYTWVQDNGKKVIGKDGKALYYSVVLDINEAEEKAKALREAIAIATEEQRKYRDVITHNAVYAYEYDLTTGTLNKNFYTENDINYLELWGMKTPCSYIDFLEQCHKTFKIEFLPHLNHQYLTKEGLLEAFYSGESQVEIEVYVPESNSYIRTTHLMSLSERDGHVHDFVYGTDITEVRREEERNKKALQEACEAAKKANASKTEFLSKMSHDMRTPMNAIIGFVAIAEENIDNKRRVLDALNKIHVSSRHLLGLIDNVLDMSKIEAGKILLNIEAFSLLELINNLLFMIQPQIRQHKHKLHVQLFDLEHEEVIGDSLRIEQVFMNILGNAIKYTPDGGDIYFSVAEKPTKQNIIKCYEMIVEDNGIGMSESFMKEIFDPFTRAEDLRTSRIQGTGLGMAIAKYNIDMMHGKIKVESEKNVGSKFTVTIYLAVQDRSEVKNEMISDQAVLVVGEEESDCKRICRILSEIEVKSKWAIHRADVAAYIQEAKEKNECFDLILIDGESSEGKGLAVANDLKEMIDPKETRIVLSVYTGSDNEEQARTAGVQYFANRPVFRSSLLKLLMDNKMRKVDDEGERQLKKFQKNQYNGKHILLAEDNDLNREIAREILKISGVEVDEACNGEEAVQMFSESEIGYYDLILMDIQMPIMNGYLATRKIRTLERGDVMNLPIIAMTANTFPEDIKESQRAGMNAHLSKPIELTKLFSLLDNWLR